jgi:hypothetical protein
MTRLALTLSLLCSSILAQSYAPWTRPMQALLANQGDEWAYATGGTITTSDGWRIHTFTSVGTSTLTVTRAGKVEVLIVAGGGASGGGNTFGSGIVIIRYRID